jgi:hypothetical protein
MTPTQTATTKRKPAAKRKAPAAAKRTTARAATSSTTSPATRVERAQQLAERAVLIPIGAALEARDRVNGAVTELVAPVRSRRELERRLTRFEKRGRTTRTRFEREVRDARRGIERRRTLAQRRVGANVEGLSDRAQNVVQSGVNAGMRLVSGAQERIAKVA